MKTQIRSIGHRLLVTSVSLLAGVTLSLLIASQASAQISPGPLAKAHQQLEGVAKCGSCHDFGAGSRRFKCLACHVEIQRRLSARLGFHSLAYKASAGETDCARCHAEHNGKQFALVRMDRRNFDHERQTGYRLEGKHRTLKCEACHTAKRISAAARSEIKLADVNRSFLGLRRECHTCHEEPHRGQLGDQCTRCHSQESWKPAPGFDHSRTSFVLTGQHLTVACQKCHGPGPGGAAVRYKGLAFNGCQSCHNDPHRGGFQEAKFQGSCQSCHNTGGWKGNHPGGAFNHAATKFPLRGKHAEVACARCHKGTDFKRPVSHERCMDCHEDPHKGQFASRKDGSDCSACHNESGFKPGLFDRTAHGRSAFPLLGKHASLACGACHQPAGRGAMYKTGKLICSACHADAHRGEFAGAPHMNRCDDCHTQDGFKPSTFSVARHAQSGFDLNGKHAAVKCDNCHKPGAPGSAPTSLPVNAASMVVSKIQPPSFHFSSKSCNTCHADPHQTKLACDTCHTTQQWKEVRPYDHSATTFRIEAGHLTVKCVQCHSPSRTGTGTPSSAPRFSETPTQCVGCHAAKNVHGDQFKKGDRAEDCSSCHTPKKWKSGEFNHDGAQFTLDRVHIVVACAKCHKEQQGPGGSPVVTYRGTPRDCVKCH